MFAAKEDQPHIYSRLQQEVSEQQVTPFFFGGWTGTGWVGLRDEGDPE